MLKRIQDRNLEKIARRLNSQAFKQWHQKNTEGNINAFYVLEPLQPSDPISREVYVQGEYLGQFTPAIHTKEYELRRQQRIAERKRFLDNTQNNSLKKQFMTLEQFEKAEEVKQRVEMVKRTAQHLRMHVLSFFDNTNNQIEPSLFAKQANDFQREIDIRMTELISQAKAELEAL